MHIQINELEQRIERVEDTRQELSLPIDINCISFKCFSRIPILWLYRMKPNLYKAIRNSKKYALKN
jgi:hypothetical protein